MSTSCYFSSGEMAEIFLGPCVARPESSPGLANITAYSFALLTAASSSDSCDASECDCV